MRTLAALLLFVVTVTAAAQDRFFHPKPDPAAISKDFAAALPVLEKAWELGRRGPRDTAWPAAEAAAGANNLDRAIHWLDVLLSSPFGRLKGKS